MDVTVTGPIGAEAVAARLDELRRLELTDREAAAAGADCLRVDVLAAIADGAVEPDKLALLALRAVDEDIGGT